MATASVSFMGTALVTSGSDSLMDKPQTYQEVSFTGTQGVTTALTAAEAGGRETVVALILLDAEAKIAWGTSPSTAATSKTSTTSAALRWPAGVSLNVPLLVGDSIAFSTV
jgi:hypothetical protein